MPAVLAVLLLVGPSAWALSVLAGAPSAPVASSLLRASADGDPGSAMLAAAERSLASGAAPGASPPARSAHPANLAPGWNETALVGSQPSQRAAAALAYDPALNTTVLFGGYDPSDAALADTWEFNGGSWTLLGYGPSTSPPGRWNANFVFDPADGYLLLYGGRNTSQFFNDTWSFTGSGWNLITPTHAPPAGYGAMTYDAKDGYVLLYGAAQGNLPSSSGWSDLAVTWKFLGGQWTNLTANVSGAPPATLLGAMAYDPVDGYALLFGGETAAQADTGCPFVAGLTWSYVNGTWTNRTPSSSANVPGGAGGIATTALTYDPSLHALVLFGGEVDQGGTCGPYGATWEYVRGNWTNLTGSLASSPGLRSFFPMTYDAADQELLLEGGGGYSLNYYGDTWALPDGAWQVALSVALNASTTEGAAPLAVNFTASASGGAGPYSYNWSFGDASAAASGANVSHTYSVNGSYTAMVRASDSNGSTGSALVFIVVGPDWIRTNDWHPVGGANASTILQPEPRSAPGLAYDPALHEVILFGGYEVNVSAYGDTWAYSNGTWTDLTTTLTAAPPARWEPGFVWDAADGYLLLFAGRNVQQFFNDTWIFNASGWTQLHPKASPPAGWVQMTYDSGDGYVLLFSSSQGNVPGGTYNPWVHWDITWSYLAGSWTNLTSTVGTQPRALTGAVFVNDPSAGYVLLYGGQSTSDVVGGCDFAIALTWTYAHGHWTNRTPNSTAGLPGGAGGLSDGAAAYDPALGGVLVFGGLTPAPGGGCMSIADTWLYANGSWSERPSWAPGATPTDRHAFAMTYDAADNESLIEGGNVFNSYEYLADSWVFGPIPNSLVARAATSGTIGAAPWQVAFVASASGGSAPYSYRWNFGDGLGAAGTDPVVSHAYDTPGIYSPALTVHDQAGRSTTLELPQIRITAPPPARINRSSTSPSGPLLGTTSGSIPVLALVVAVAAVGAVAGGLMALGASRRRAQWRAEGLALGASVSRTDEPEPPIANGRD